MDSLYEVRFTNNSRLYLAAENPEKAIERAQEIVKRHPETFAEWDLIATQHPKPIDCLISRDASSWIAVHGDRLENLESLETAAFA